jgi:hypothetical protein
MVRASKGSVSTNSSRRPDEGRAFHAAQCVKPRGNKKGRSDENRNGLVLLCYLCLALLLFADACFASRRFEPPLQAIVPDNAPAK